jgi:hypothetical protein
MTGFLNSIVEQLWPNINVAGGKMVKDIVEPMFKQMYATDAKVLNELRYLLMRLFRLQVAWSVSFPPLHEDRYRKCAT